MKELLSKFFIRGASSKLLLILLHCMLCFSLLLQQNSLVCSSTTFNIWEVYGRASFFITSASKLLLLLCCILWIHYCNNICQFSLQKNSLVVLPSTTFEIIEACGKRDSFFLHHTSFKAAAASLLYVLALILQKSFVIFIAKNLW